MGADRETKSCKAQHPKQKLYKN